MILNSAHPELLHFLTTHSVQRASHDSDHSDVITTRNGSRRSVKADDDAIWSWWRVQKDGLRDIMVAEANGECRRLEQEKRMVFG